MSEDLGEAKLALLTDQSGLDKGLDASKAKTVGFLRDVQKAFKENLSKSIGQGIGQGIGQKAFDVVHSAIAGVQEFIGESIQAASDLEQSAGSVVSVFGRAAGKIAAFGETADQALGLSKNSVNELSAVLGAQLQGMGFGLDEAADKALLLEQRGADLAATFGGTTKQAIEAISALLRGERDPIERYGVSIKDADVKARILAKGLDTSTTAAAKNANAVASLDLLFESTAKSAGQFARETDTLAGSQARYNAELENEKAALGEDLIPLQKDYFDFMRDVGIPALRTSVELAKKAAAGLQFMAEAIDDAFGVGDNAEKMNFQFERASLNSRQLGRAAGEGVGAAMGALADLRSSVGKVGTKAQGTSRLVERSMGDIATAIRNARDSIVDAMNDVVDLAYDPLILAAEISATKVELAEQRKIAASSKSTAAEKRDARIRILDLERTLGQQLNEQTKYGTDAQRLARLTGRATSRELVAGLKSGDAARRAASQAAAADIASGIIALMRSTNTYGVRTGNAYVDGLISAFENRLREARRAVGIYRNLLVASSPPGPESPLHEIDKWGYRTGDAWVGRFVGAIVAGRDGVRGALGAIAGDLSSGRFAPLSSPRFPSLTASIVPRSLGLAGAGGAASTLAAGMFPVSRETPGSVTKIYRQDVRLEGPPKARDPLGVAKALGRFARSGALEDAYEKGPARDE